MTHYNAPKTNFLLIFARFREVGSIGFILLLVIIFSLISPSFLTFGNMRDILMDISILVIVVLAQVAAQIAINGRQYSTPTARVVYSGSSSLPPHIRAGGTVGHGY